VLFLPVLKQENKQETTEEIGDQRQWLGDAEAMIKLLNQLYGPSKNVLLLKDEEQEKQFVSRKRKASPSE
jgi:hypothetical protein